MNTLRERCSAFIKRLGTDHDPVDSLLEFVVAEIGRAASPNMDELLPVCLYFPTAADRDGFVAAVQAAMPNFVARSVP